MARQLRHLLTTPAATEEVSSDFVIILAALVSALICFLGLVTAARCGCRRGRVSQASSLDQNQRSVNKGLKKNELKSWPTQAYSSEFSNADCAICLGEFADGDELRVIPPCGHGFHVACIDAWLGSNPSCPLCRCVSVVERCRKCGGVPPVAAAAAQYLP